jgi:hypothetical protein
LAYASTIPKEAVVAGDNVSVIVVIVVVVPAANVWTL